MKWHWIYCHSHTEQSEKLAYSVIKTTTDGNDKSHSLYVFTIDLSKNMEVKCLVKGLKWSIWHNIKVVQQNIVNKINSQRMGFPYLLLKQAYLMLTPLHLNGNINGTPKWVKQEVIREKGQNWLLSLVTVNNYLDSNDCFWKLCNLCSCHSFVTSDFTWTGNQGVWFIS